MQTKSIQRSDWRGPWRTARLAFALSAFLDMWCTGLSSSLGIFQASPFWRKKFAFINSEEAFPIAYKQQQQGSYFDTYWPHQMGESYASWVQSSSHCKQEHLHVECRTRYWSQTCRVIVDKLREIRGVDGYSRIKFTWCKIVEIEPSPQPLAAHGVVWIWNGVSTHLKSTGDPSGYEWRESQG